MDELKTAPTRPLNDFERAALKLLHHDKDIEIREGVNRIQMVGSIRAGKDCLDCHSVRRGALLGAFSYELQRVKPIREPKGEPHVMMRARPEVSFARNLRPDAPAPQGGGA